jgi:DDE family transposase
MRWEVGVSASQRMIRSGSHGSGGAAGRRRGGDRSSERAASSAGSVRFRSPRPRPRGGCWRTSTLRAWTGCEPLARRRGSEPDWPALTSAARSRSCARVGRTWAGLVIDLDTALVAAHSEKEGCKANSRPDSAIARSWRSWTTGYGRFPSHHFASNAVWLELALSAADLIAWAQAMRLHGEPAAAGPKKLRYQLLHAAARITRGQRRIWVRIDESWPWATHSPPPSPG